MLIRCLPRHPIREIRSLMSPCSSRRDVLGIGLVGTGALLTPLAHARLVRPVGPRHQANTADIYAA